MADEQTNTLTPYFGRDVTQAKIEIRNVGGGLQEALRFNPVELDPDEERWIALKVRVDGIRFDHIKDEEGLARVHIFKPVDDRIAMLDDDPHLVKLVEKHIDSYQDRVRVAKEQAAGVFRLPGTEEDDEDGDEEPFGHETADTDGADGPEPTEGLRVVEDPRDEWDDDKDGSEEEG